MTPAQMAVHLQSKGEPKCEAMDAFFIALFEGCGKGLHKEIHKKKTYLDAAVQDEASQKNLLSSIEMFCANLPANASKEIALLLKILYDEEILEEEQILLWSDAVPATKGVSNDSDRSKAAFVRKSARPFVDWLRNAEAESEENVE
jgi:translation initiation factor 5